MTEHAVEAQGIRLTHGRVVALDGVDLQVHAGASSASWATTGPGRPR